MKADVILGDCLNVLRSLPGESVNCCVTSPPYWGLRDYGTATWEGGDDGCDHKGAALASSSSSLAGYSSENVKIRTFSVPFKAECGKCGARRIDSQIGLESTPEAYVENLVAVFREVRRVLAKDGTCWLNLGDSFAGHNVKGWRDGNEVKNGGASNKNGVGYVDGLKPKDLVGIPWRVAFALQADGWYLRSDIIWAKPNPMPESVTDRPTKSHEYVFLLTKSARYWYDAGAIQEPSIGAWNSAVGFGGDEKKSAGDPKLRTQGHGTVHADEEKTGRNARTVWTIATQPYTEAHFATFPSEIPRRCIRAGCPAGGVVLDPFCGSGTTGAVTVEEGREFVGIELNPAYVALAEKRIRAAQPPLFAGGVS